MADLLPSSETEMNERQGLLGNSQRWTTGRGRGRGHRGQRRGQGVGGGVGRQSTAFGPAHSNNHYSSEEQSGDSMGSNKSAPSVLNFDARIENRPLDSHENRPLDSHENRPLDSQENQQRPAQDPQGQQPAQDPQPPAQAGNNAVRNNFVRLVDQDINNDCINYPLKTHCFRGCTKAISKNRKKCSTIVFIFAIMFLAASIACAVLLYGYPKVLKDSNSTTILHIPPMSVVEVNPSDYNISTMKRHGLTIATVTKETNSEAKEQRKGLIKVATDHKEKSYTKTKLPIKTIQYKKDKSKSLLRYWPSLKDVSVNITVHHSGTSQTSETSHASHTTIVWVWGTLHNSIPQIDCKSYNEYNHTTSTHSDATTFFDTKPSGNYHVIRIEFCSNTDTESKADIDITERVHLPHKRLYKCIFVDEKLAEDSVEVEFQGLLSELHKHSKLYINTNLTMSSSSEEDGEEVMIQLQPQSSESNPLREMLIVIMTLSLFVSIMLFFLGCCCLFCCKKKEFCALGLFYRDKEE